MQENVLLADAANFDEVVVKSPLPVVIYFYSDDCLPCLTFEPIFERAAKNADGQIRFVKVFRPHARQLAEKLSVKTSPTLIFMKDGAEVCKRLTGYISFFEFKEALDNIINKACPAEERATIRCDVIIIGAGPSGLTAAIYTARSRLYTVVIDANIPGGQVATTYTVSNYPGTNGEIKGLDLVENMTKQALSFGAQIDDMQRIVEMDLTKDEKYVKTDFNDYYAKTVIIATGSEPRKLPVPQEREFRGRGIHYCATCDGALYVEADVIVVGGGTSSIEEAHFLTRYAKSVTIVNRSDKFKAAQSSIDEATKNPQITILYSTVVKEVQGDNFVQGVVLEDVTTHETRDFKTDGLFVYIGSIPNSEPFKDTIRLSERGYIVTDENMATNIPGVFAAGDIREKEIRQITTAVGDGTIAGIMAERFINRK